MRGFLDNTNTKSRLPKRTRPPKRSRLFLTAVTVLAGVLAFAVVASLTSSRAGDSRVSASEYEGVLVLLTEDTQPQSVIAAVSPDQPIAIGPSLSSNVVDGKVSTGEYAGSFEITSPPPCTASSPCGTVHFTIDTSTVYAAFEYNANDVGLDGVVGGGDDPVINENVFGPKKDFGCPGDATEGSYHGCYNTGWGNHGFDKLLKSDALRMQLFCTTTSDFDFGSPDFDWAQDYLEEGGPGGWNSPSGLAPGDAKDPAAPAAGPVPSGLN
ncbi:MAG: hypothetical protein ACE5FA_09320, partial [Dehalococcoidia bacterium]